MRAKTKEVSAHNLSHKEFRVVSQFSYLQGVNAQYLEGLYQQYLDQQQGLSLPAELDVSWQHFFDGLTYLARSEGTMAAAPQAKPGVKPSASPSSQGGATQATADVMFRAGQWIASFRQEGHLAAELNPLEAKPALPPVLEPGRYRLGEAELKLADEQLRFPEGHLLSQIIEHFKQVYCGKVGCEVMHLVDEEARQWWLQKLEAGSLAAGPLDQETQRFILKRLTQSEGFERFLHTRYVAQKRFSLEGTEALIPALDALFEKGAELGAQEFVLGMAHRGRLNVLAQTLGKKVELILTQFEDQYPLDSVPGEGDVKYHLGCSTDLKTRQGHPLHLTMASNPSHLEFVYPVIEGITRAKQARLLAAAAAGSELAVAFAAVVPVAIHGDASFAGQGVCYETLNLAQLAGYQTGGTIHIVINNQVGFTASPAETRSTRYCTDLAKTIGAPVFHVNADAPEELWRVAQLAIEYRQKFKKDVFIDLVGYRKYGHNEGDEPAFTQPAIYQKIKTHPSVREQYSAWLVQTQQRVTQEEAAAWIAQTQEKLLADQVTVKTQKPSPVLSHLQGLWAKIRRPSLADLLAPVATAVRGEQLAAWSAQLNQVPAEFNVHPKLKRLLESREKAVQEGVGMDWGNAEALAFASLLAEGYHVRLSGQDSGRGTFSHRHAIWADIAGGPSRIPLAHFAPGSFQVYNSHLSETGVLAFEYGYSLVDPQVLVLWEAQFGDFANGAQVILDQFLAAGESKWSRMSGLTLLLPHGYEGQGAEHSSARLERFLQLAGKENWQVCNLSTPAQFFHALRRQLHASFRKPLVIMTPKSLLRNPAAVSKREEFCEQGFQLVLDDPAHSKTAVAALASGHASVQAASTTGDEKNAASVKKVLLCSGKIYYDLKKAQQEQQKSAPSSGGGGVAVVRIEQLYPWPESALQRVLAGYPESAKLVWVQEEPRNMGAWSYVHQQWCGSGGEEEACFQAQVGGRGLEYVGRGVAAAPAVASHRLHEHEQEMILEKAFL